MAIDMYCDHCEDLISEHVPGGVRLKIGKKEYVFHLCLKCQSKFKDQVKNKFLDGRAWKELS